MGNAIYLVNNFKVKQVIFNNGEYNDLELSLIEVLREKNISYYQNIEELNIGNNIFYFLNDELHDDENDSSNVIYTELNNYKLLFMGDAGIELEEVLLNKYNLKDIDILKVGHHGSKTSSSKEFITEVNPKYSLISVGKNNRYGHPNSEVLENLDDSAIYRTDEDGSVMFTIKNNKLEIGTCPP
jgi:competence protein ComEC